jgi:transposase
MGNDLIVLDRKARRELEQLLTDGNTAQKIAKRARIVLMTADGHGVVAIMREVGVSKTTVWRWQDYFAEAGVDGLIKGRSKPPGRKPLSAAMKLKVVEKTVKERPANATHWSVRSMAEEMGISHTSVQRIWAEHGLKPHLVRSFKVSNDPDFVAKVEDIVGLYVDPPEKALVLSVDEKSQIQALDRTRGLALEEGPGRNHDPITSATAPRRSLRLSISRLARSSANACPAIEPRSSWTSSKRSTARLPPISICI